VVSLPAGIFQPYSGVKTSILFMDRVIAKKTKDILFVKIENDGRDLGAQRRPIDKNDLPAATEILKRYKMSIQTGEQFVLSDEDKQLTSLVPIEKISTSGDYNLSGDRYKETINYVNRKWPMVELGGLEKEGKIYFLRGQGLSKTDISEDGKCECIHYGDIYTLYDPIIKQVINKTNFDGKIISVKGDVLVPATTTADAMGIAVARSLNKDGIIIGGDINIIRTKNDFVLSDYLALLISNPPLKLELAKHAKGANILHLSNSDLKRLQFPLPPLEVQQEIVAQLDSYQRIIDGAKQVVDNYKPEIKIDPSWEIVSLEDVVYFKRGPFGGSLKKEIFVSDGYKVYEQKHAIRNDFEIGNYYIDEQKYREMIDFAVHPGDIIVSCSGTMGRVAIVPTNIKPGIINQALLKLSPKKEVVFSVYLKITLETESIQNKHFRDTSGSAIQNVSSVANLKQIKIPLPPIDIQKQIVARIEEEQQIVDASKKLIQLYQEKIKEKIDEVWGN
jgi:type I restriction enzyme M protein